MKKRLSLFIALICSATLFTLNAQNWNEIINATSSDANAGDRFGYRVSIDGDYAIVGANDDDDDGFSSGSAYIFVRSGSSWTEQAKLTASDAAVTDYFGFSVSIAGDFAIVGAANNDDNGSDSGSAYVFMRSGSSWTEQAKLTASDATANDYFGYSVSIAGDYAIVGARDNDDNGSSSGSAYVFIRSGNSWTEQAKLTASDAAANDLFGFSVSIAGDYAIVGALGNDDDGGNSGSAYVFMRSGSNWTEQAKLIASDAAPFDQFGQTVSISGDYAIVSAVNKDDNGNDSGSAYVFMRSGSSWTEQAKLTASDAAASDGFGSSVSIAGDYAIVGASGNDDNATNSGSAYIFMRSGSSWTEQAKLTASDADANDYFGGGVAIAGDYAIVGAYRNDDNGSDSGSAYFFKLNPIVPDLETLTELTAECESTPTAPTANSTAITATSNVAFPITIQGTTIVTWTYDDGNGNTLTQTQNVIIDDTTAPNMSFANPSDALIESCATEVVVPSPLAIDSCVTNDFALDFDGVDDMVTINQTIGSFKTIEFWMYTENGINGSEEFDYLFSFNDSNLKYIGTGNFTSNYTNETLSMVTNFGEIMTTYAVIPPGWNHIAITGNGSSFNQIIINGDSKPVVNNGFPQVFEATTTYLGQSPSAVVSRFNGELDEVRFWDTAKTEQEIANDYEKMIDASTTNLLAYYDFEDGPGSAFLTDKTGNGAHGVLNNMDINTNWIASTSPATSVTLTNDFNGTSDASGTYPEGQTTVTWTATDANGNTNTLQQIINAGDTEGPEISFANPSDASITTCDTNVTITTPLVSDDCSINTALNFDGTNDYINLGSPLLSPSNASQPHTVEMWVKTTPKNAYTILLNQYGWNQLYEYRSVFYIDTAANGGNLVFFKGSYVNIEGTTNLLDNQWHHVAMVRESSGTLSLYVDGVVEAVGLDTYPYSNTNSLLGGQTLLSDNYYSGAMDEVRIWNTARTQTQIANSFNSNISNSESGLVAYYKFEDGTGSGVISDDSSNSNNGSLINMDINAVWIPSTAPVASVTLTNDFNGTSDASGTYPDGETTVTWTATDTSGNQSTLQQLVNIDCSITYTFNNGVWSPSDPSGVSTVDDDIVITSGNAVININTTCDSLTVNPGAGLTVNSGVTLTTTSTVLESNSTSYSSLILDGIIAGNLSYQRHVNINGTGTTGSNDLVSPPLTGQDFVSFAAVNPNILNNGSLYLFGPFEKVTGQYVNWPATETTTLNAGVGYRTGTTDNGTVTFTGTAENGTITNNIVNAGTNNQEWNLVGNPYPSYLNVQDFLSHDLSGVTNIQLFDAATAAIYGYDGTAQNGWTIYNLANTTTSTLIAPGQGFFVSADATNTALYDLEFTPDMRRTGSGDDFIVGRNAELTFVKLNASTVNKSYNTEFYFNPNATAGFDLGYDAALWGTTAPEFSIYSHLVQDNIGKPIALQTLNATDLTEVSIPLGVNANQGEQITFSIADITLPASVNIYLDDVVANTTTLLNNSDYSITPTTNLSGTGRFFLRTSEDALSTIDNNLDTLNIFALNNTKEVVVTGQLQEATSLELFDIQGRKVLTVALDNSTIENRIDVSSLSGGVYVVNIKNNTQQKTQKVILK